MQNHERPADKWKEEKKTVVGKIIPRGLAVKHPLYSFSVEPKRSFKLSALSVMYSPSWNSPQKQSTTDGIKLVNNNNEGKNKRGGGGGEVGGEHNEKTPKCLRNHRNVVSGWGYQCQPHGTDC